MLSRLSAIRRLPRTFAIRYYTDGRTAGSVASSKGFNKREQAQEGQYFQRREQEEIRKLKAKLAAEIEGKQAELDSLEKEEEGLEKEKKE